MRPVKVFTDSTSDLSPELIKHHNIDIIPLYVNFEQESFRDGVDISPSELFQKVKDSGIMPKTSAPTVLDFITAFKKYMDDGLDIVHVSISSKISASYQNACAAAEELPEGRVKVIDSLNLSCGIGLLALTAAECVESGMDLSNTESTVRSAVARARSSFAIDTVEYLYKGGRCSGLQFLLSSLLEIHPVIAVQNDGTMHVASKVRGNFKGVLRSLVNSVVANPDTLDPGTIVVNNCECAAEGAEVKAQLEEMNIFRRVLWADAGCVIASHCGPKTIGLFYFGK